MTVRELCECYAELFTDTTQARNRTWLIRRIIWRIQSLAGGGQPNRLATGPKDWPILVARFTALRALKLSPDASERT
jgi:hypothetical protein